MEVGRLYKSSISVCRKMKVLAKADEPEGEASGAAREEKFPPCSHSVFIIKKDFSAEKSTKSKKSFPAREMIAAAIVPNSVRNFPMQQALYRTNG